MTHTVTVYLLEPPAGLSIDDINAAARNDKDPNHDRVEAWREASFSGAYDPGQRYVEAIRYEVDDAVTAMGAANEAFERFNIGDDDLARQYRASGSSGGRRSMSVGDVLVYDGAAMLCARVGWEYLSDFDADRAEADTILDLVRGEADRHAGGSDLVYVDYRDQLSDEQLIDLFTGDVEKAMESVAEFIDDAQYHGCNWWLNEGFSVELRERIEAAGIEDEVRDVLCDLDRSTPFDDLVSRTGRELFLYPIGVDDSDWDDYDLERAWSPADADEKEAAQTTKMRQILDLRGLDMTLDKNRESLDEVIANNVYHGGNLYVIWYGNVADMVKHVLAADQLDDDAPTPLAEITFTDPWILAFNSNNPRADQNGDGLITPADFNAWIVNFNNGCD